MAYKQEIGYMRHRGKPIASPGFDPYIPTVSKQSLLGFISSCKNFNICISIFNSHNKL